MSFIKNMGNERYKIFRSINPNPKNWEYDHFISEMTTKYMESKKHKESWLTFRIIDQDDFTEFIKKEVL